MSCRDNNDFRNYTVEVLTNLKPNYMEKAKTVDGRKLVVVSGRTKGTAFILTEPQVSAGSECDNAIYLKGKRVSRHHAVLVRNNGEYSLRDVSPRIGTLLNGRRTKEAHLKIGDRIHIGEFEMSYEAATAPASDAPSTTTLPQPDEITTPIIPIMAPELVAENPILEHQQHRITELTQEAERLAGELKLAKEATESLRVQLHTRSDQHADLMERLNDVSKENAALINLNDKFQTKISKLEAAAARSNPVKEEMATTRAEVPGERNKVTDPSVDIAPVVVESDEARMAAAKTQEEAVAKRQLSERTNEQFDSLRRTIVEKKNLRSQMTLLDRFLLPFRDTARLIRESTHTDAQ
jgi:pSer/pThr/pTyr-binding forkhead associated (FHA) protein